MPYNGIEDGLYMLRQTVEKNGVPLYHYGILVVGNVLNIPGAGSFHPVVIHQTRPRLRSDYLHDTGNWIITAKIADIEGAAARINKASENPEYDLFGNNCEHFARFIAEGQSYSGQVILASGVALFGLIMFARSRSNGQHYNV